MYDAHGMAVCDGREQLVDDSRLLLFGEGRLREWQSVDIFHDDAVPHPFHTLEPLNIDDVGMLQLHEGLKLLAQHLPACGILSRPWRQPLEHPPASVPLGTEENVGLGHRELLHVREIPSDSLKGVVHISGIG